MGERVKKLKYAPGRFCGILTSGMNSHKYNIFKGLISEILKDNGCYIFAYNNEQEMIEKERKIKSWNIDYYKYIKNGQIIAVSTDEYLKNNRLDIQNVYNYYYNLIDKCRRKGYKKILIYGVRDGFYEGKFTLDESYEFHRIIKKIALEKKVMILTHFFLDDFNEEYFYSLMNLYHMFMLYDSSSVYIYKSKSFLEIEALFKYLKNTFVDRTLLHKENRRLEFLNDLILATSYKQTNDDLLDTSLRKTAEIIGVDFGYITKFTDGDFTEKSIEGKYNLSDSFIEELENCRFHSDEVIGNINQKVFILTEEDFDTPQKKYLSNKYNVRTIATIPIGLRNGPATELMFLFSHKEKEAIQEYLPLLETLGSTLWILIQKQKMYEDYQKNILRTEKLRALGELAGGIAHDFNNLLTTILGFSQIALTHELSEDINKYIDIIYRSALDGKNIVERIQNFNRKQFNDKKDIYSINAIVESSIEMARPRWKNFYESRGNNLKVVKELHSTSNILCVEHEIREVIINLLSNAMDAMENGGTLTVKTYDVDSKSVVEINDTGSGIPEEIKEEIFEPFYSTKGAKGTGLGLSIVKEIVEEHSGKVLLESKVGEGSNFKLYFDIFHEEAGNMETSIVDTNVKLDIGKELNILVVDDIPQVGDTIVQMLDTIGVHAESEVMSEKVIDRLSEKRYDIIICDLAMPELNGVELSKVVKKQYAKTKFIIITGWPGRFKGEGYESIDYILSKPCTLEDLATSIKNVL